jgi:hypothetical protein
MAVQAGFLDIVQWLVKDGKTIVNDYVAQGVTPVFLAAQKGNVDIVKFLVQEGEVDVNQTTLVNEETPLYIAAKKGYVKVVEFLFRETNMNTHLRAGSVFLPLSIAAERGHHEVVNFIVEEEVERRRLTEIGGVAIVSAQDRVAATVSALEESRSLAEDLAARDRRILELESTLAREIYNNTDLAKSVVSIERRAQAAEVMVESHEEWRRLAVKQVEGAERKADVAVKEQRLAVMRAGEAERRAREAEKRTVEMQINADRNLQEAQRKWREAETKVRRLEGKLGTESKRSAELETECERLTVRTESAEGRVLRIKVEAGEDVNDARSDTSAARTGAYLQQSQAKHSKVKLENLATEHESGQTILRDKVEELEDGLTCVICMVKPKNVCLFPCSHVCMCEACAGESWVEPCPICREPVMSKQKLFFA